MRAAAVVELGHHVGQTLVVLDGRRPGWRRCSPPGRRLAIARSSASVLTSRQSGTTSDITTADVVAATSQRDPSPHQPVGVPRAGPRPPARCAGSAAPRPTRRACAAAGRGARRRFGPSRRTPVPDLGEQLPLGHHLADPGGQQEKDVELLARQLDRLPGQARRSTALVDPQVTDRDRRRWCGIASASAQHRTDPRRDLLGSERFDDVVVGAAVEGLDHRGVVVLGGDHDDRDLAGRADHRDQGQPLDVGQSQVEQHHVRPLGDHLLEGGHPGGDRDDGVPAVAQAALQGGADRLVVLDHQDPGHGRNGSPATARSLRGWHT